MKWLQDNPLGLALLALSGVFALLALGMAITWSWPVTVDLTGNEIQEADQGNTVLAAHPVAAISNFQVINEKPVFNESRRPVVEEVDGPEVAEDVTIEVKGAPDVRLTGVIITPAMKIASLTPADEKLESVMAHEGQALTGEYVGWQVSKVNPRTVVLKSTNGQKLELDLQVHDVKIKEPPKAAPPAKTARTKADQGKQVVDEDGEPLSRAEQIRQRIAERREELRLEQEEKQAQSGARPGSSQAATKRTYQSAIRDMGKKNNREKSDNGKKDG